MTGTRTESVAVAAADQAFGSLAAALTMSKNDLECLFNTIWKDATSREEKWLCLQAAKARGLNPLKGELMVSKRGGQLTFQTSYYVFVSRARRGGWTLKAASPVWQKDTWGGWDTVAGRPVQHIQTSFGDRGRLLGAWATLTDGTRDVGALMELGDLAISPQWKQSDERWTKEARDDVWEAIKIGAYGPFWQRAPGRMSEKCVFAHLSRRMVPDLESLYLPEEIGSGHESGDGTRPPVDITARPASVDEAPVTDAVVVDGEVAAPQPAAPEAAPAAPVEVSADERVMRAFGRLGQDNRRIAQAITAEAFRGKEQGAKLSEAEKMAMAATAECAMDLVGIDGGETARRIAAEESVLPLIARFRTTIDEFNAATAPKPEASNG